MLDQLFSMKGKTCVVTGGSRGLGYYMAKGFLSAGAKRVYITASMCWSITLALGGWKNSKTSQK